MCLSFLPDLPASLPLFLPPFSSLFFPFPPFSSLFLLYGKLRVSAALWETELEQTMTAKLKQQFNTDVVEVQDQSGEEEEEEEERSRERERQAHRPRHTHTHGAFGACLECTALLTDMQNLTAKWVVLVFVFVLVLVLVLVLVFVFVLVFVLVFILCDWGGSQVAAGLPLSSLCSLRHSRACQQSSSTGSCSLHSRTRLQKCTPFESLPLFQNLSKTSKAGHTKETQKKKGGGGMKERLCVGAWVYVIVCCRFSCNG